MPSARNTQCYLPRADRYDTFCVTPTIRKTPPKTMRTNERRSKKTTTTQKCVHVCTNYWNIKTNNNEPSGSSSSSSRVAVDEFTVTLRVCIDIMGEQRQITTHKYTSLRHYATHKYAYICYMRMESQSAICQFIVRNILRAISSNNSKYITMRFGFFFFFFSILSWHWQSRYF